MAFETSTRPYLDLEGLAAGWRPDAGRYALKATCHHAGGIIGSRITFATDIHDLNTIILEATQEAAEYHAYVRFSRDGSSEPYRDGEIVLTAYYGREPVHPADLTARRVA